MTCALSRYSADILYSLYALYFGSTSVLSAFLAKRVRTNSKRNLIEMSRICSLKRMNVNVREK